LGLTASLAQALEDERQGKKIKHELSELVTQRVMAIACGYPDTNDAARLGSDPVHKLLVGRDPIQGEDASALAKRKANRPIVQRLLRRSATQQISIQ